MQESETLSKRSPWGIRHKVLGLVVLAALLPTALVGSSSYWSARSTLMEKLSDQLNTRATLAAARISEWLQERQQDARVFAESSIVASNVIPSGTGEAARKLIGAYLEEVNGRYELYRTLAVVDESGNVVAAAGEEAERDLDRLGQQALDGGWALEWNEEGALLWLGRPVLGDGGRAAGRLVLACDFESLRETVSDRENLERLRLSAASDRLVFAHPKVPGGDVGFPESIPVEGEIVEFVDGRGVRVLAAARSVSGTELGEPLVLTVTTDREVAFASVTELRQRILLLSAFAVLLVVALAYGLVASLIDPLERLTAGARAVANGDYGTGLPVRGGDEIGYLTEVFNQMTSSLKASHERLEHLSVTDELTQLANRRELQSALVEELAKATRTGEPLSIVMIDIDHFKSFNDRYGHLRGDELLAKLGSYLRSGLPKGARAARYGGEEFLVILPKTTLEEAVERAETLRAGFSSNERPDGVTLSLGVATWRHDGTTAAELIDSADRALYEAKGLGRNRVVAASEPPAKSSPREKPEGSPVA